MTRECFRPWFFTTCTDDAHAAWTGPRSRMQATLAPAGRRP